MELHGRNLSNCAGESAARGTAHRAETGRVRGVEHTCSLCFCSFCRQHNCTDSAHVIPQFTHSHEQKACATDHQSLGDAAPDRLHTYVPGAASSLLVSRSAFGSLSGSKFRISVTFWIICRTFFRNIWQSCLDPSNHLGNHALLYSDRCMLTSWTKLPEFQEI